MMSVLDPQTGVIVDVNPAACSFYGYSREQFVGMPVAIVNEVPLAEWKALVFADRGDNRGPHRFRNRLADGDVREVESFYTLVNVDGRPLLHTIVHDVTVHVRALRELAASEKRFRLLAENAQDFIFRFRLTEPQGFEYVSPAAERILGLTPEQL